MNIQHELSIRGESIQRIYDLFIGDLFLVNRRYQRKLVWTIEEKQAFIGSIDRGFPIPLILTAEVSYNGQTRFEIIDGMQRLNAIVSFIEGEFPVDGGYFDLNALVSTKLRFDKKELQQRTPVLSREACSRIANYSIPLSVYKVEQEDNIDEIFRRINSSGRQLSRQELRHAGMTGLFPELVRKVSCSVRGDTSHSDKLVLRQMKEISITSKKLSYGISLNEVFWRREKIITSNNIRQSRDEELVAHLLAYMALGANPPPPCSSGFLDFLYGGVGEDSEYEPNEADNYYKKFDIENAVKQKTPERLAQQFIFVHEQIRKVAESDSEPLGDSLFTSKPESVSQHYQVVFLAFYEILVNENLQIQNPLTLKKKLRGIAEKLGIRNSVNATWNSFLRQKAIDLLKLIVRECCVQKLVAEDPAKTSWNTELENLLMGSKTEQALYDFKLGFHRLENDGKFDEDLFKKICKTISAIANSGPNNVGYIVVGIADQSSDAVRHSEIYNSTPLQYNGFLICGIDDEAKSHHKSVDIYFRKIIQGLEKSPISPPEVANQIVRDARVPNYRGKSVVVLKIHAGDQPTLFDGKIYERIGSSVHEVAAEQHISLYKRFLAKSK